MTTMRRRRHLPRCRHGMPSAACTTAGRSTAPTRCSAAVGSSRYAGSSIAITEIARVRYLCAHWLPISDFCTPSQ